MEQWAKYKLAVKSTDTGRRWAKNETLIIAVHYITQFFRARGPSSFVAEFWSRSKRSSVGTAIPYAFSIRDPTCCLSAGCDKEEYCRGRPHDHEIAHKQA